MSNQRYSPEFKDEAVRQIVDRGYSVAEVSERLGVSAHSLYKWVKAIKPDKTDEQAAALVEARSEVHIVVHEPHYGQTVQTLYGLPQFSRAEHQCSFRLAPLACARSWHSSAGSHRQSSS